MLLFCNGVIHTMDRAYPAVEGLLKRALSGRQFQADRSCTQLLNPFLGEDHA